MSHHVPTRMCIACRSRRPATALRRLGRDEGGRIVPRARLDRGRSAWLCPGPACLARANKTGAWARAFRGAVVSVPDGAALDQSASPVARTDRQAPHDPSGRDPHGSPSLLGSAPLTEADTEPAARTAGVSRNS